MTYDEFMALRREQAIAALQPDPESPDPGFPFDSPDYPWTGVVDEHLGASTARRLSRMSPDELVRIDPYETSEMSGWPGVWDSAIGIPASRIRATPASSKSIPAFRAINDAWQNRTYQDLGNIGRTTVDGEYRRPSGEWILDAVTDRRGWWLLELAHMLAHRAEDASELARRPLPYDYGRNGELFQTMLFRAFLCRKFGLPLDTRPGEPCDDSMDPFSRYGIVPFVSSSYRNPVLRVPANGRGCLEPGKAVCVVCGSERIEPTPHSIATGSDTWLAMNRWSCLPTIVSFVGWELVDVVTHAPLVANPWSGSSDYAMAPMTLQEAPSFVHLLECAARARGSCEPDFDRYWPVDEYLESDRFQKDLSESPPLPCKRCLKLNMESDGSPERPRSKRPDKPAKDGDPMTPEQREWFEWDAKMNKVYQVVEKATKYMEIRELGAEKAVRARKSRKSAYSKKVNTLRRTEFLRRKAEKLRKNGFISKAEEIETKIGELTP